MRSHDQWNTMQARGLKKYDLVDITNFAKDGTVRSVRGYRAIAYNLPPGYAMGYVPNSTSLRYR